MLCSMLASLLWLLVRFARISSTRAAGVTLHELGVGQLVLEHGQFLLGLGLFLVQAGQLLLAVESAPSWG